MNILFIEPDHRCGLDPFPWGALSVGSYLYEQGHDVTLLSGSLLTQEEFDSQVAANLPDASLLCISIFSTDTAWAKDFIDDAKSNFPDLPICVGGPHAILMPEQTLRYKHIDYLAYGPGEETVHGLIHALEKGETPHNVPGLIWKKDGQEVRNAPAGAPPRYMINYDLLPTRKRATYGRYFEILAGRGCSFACAFCYNAVCGHKWQGKDAEDLIDEIQSVVCRFDPDLIYFRDENFFHSRKRVHRFIELYRERGFRFQWHATCRANYFTDKYLNESLLRDLESVNCVKLKFGMESGSQVVLDILRKGIKVEQIKHVARTLAKSPIVGNYSFLTAVPGEKVRDFHDTLSLINDIVTNDPNAEIIGPQYYRVYPGGELYEQIMRDWGYQEPTSFEEWADAVRGDYFGLSKDVDHPWFDGDPSLPKLADIMVLLRRKPLIDMLSLFKLPAIPFALLARLRMQFGFFRGLWDMRLAAWMFSKYVASISLPKGKLDSG